MLQGKITAFDGHITLEPVAQMVTVHLGDAKLAETTSAIKLSEGSYPAVYYIPRSDIDESHMSPSPLKTKCPWKGEASYLSYETGTQGIDNLVWMYEQAIDEVAVLRGYVSFDKRHVRIETS